MFPRGALLTAEVCPLRGDRLLLWCAAKERSMRNLILVSLALAAAGLCAACAKKTEAPAAQTSSNPSTVSPSLKAEDHSPIGPAGRCQIKDLRAYK